MSYLIYNLSNKNIINLIRERSLTGKKISYETFDKNTKCLICKQELQEKYYKKGYGNFCMSCGVGLFDFPENSYEDYYSQQYFW